MDEIRHTGDTTHRAESMRRIQFIEFHDQPWFPSSVRDYVTDALQFGFNLFNVYAPSADSNQPSAYAEFVASQIGGDPSQTVSSALSEGNA